MIACCSDGTRPVIFKIERIDYKAVYIEGISDVDFQKKVKDTVMQIEAVTDVVFRDEYAEIYLQNDVADEVLKNTVEGCGQYRVIKRGRKIFCVYGKNSSLIRNRYV